MKKIFLSLILTLIFSNTASAKNFYEWYLDHFYPDTIVEKRLEEKYKKAIYLDCEYIQKKNPYTAMGLSVLPGGGSFYTGEIGLGLTDVILYPLGSIAWEIPLSWKRAKFINMTETVKNCEAELMQQL